MPAEPPFSCGKHTAVIYERGGLVEVGELMPLTMVNWRRVRDDTSSAQISVANEQCCTLLASLETVAMELHIFRDGLPVWEGPIVRLEYHREHVDIFATDILWVASRTALDQGYSHAYPNIGVALDRMDWLLRTKTFNRFGDPWRMISPNHLHKVIGPDDPRTAKSVNAWSMSTWEDFDNYAEDGGTDYTVVNRDVYYWDLQFAWATLPPIDESMLSQWPHVVEYGNDFASRWVQTNGQGYAGLAEAPGAIVDHYTLLDAISTAWSTAATTDVPTAEELATMAATARKELTEHYPPPVSVLVPANTTLMPHCPWNIDDMIPGAWFDVTVTGTCRTLTQVQRLHEVNVTETAQDGENFAITTISAPAVRIDP